MASINMVTTIAGRAAIANALANAATINVVDAQLSNIAQAANGATTALSSVVATRPVVGTVRPAGGGFALHLVITDDSSAAYDVRALAVRLANGTYLMVCSQAALIASKGAGSSLHLAFDLTIDAATAGAVEFGDTDYQLPMAGEASAGLVELATLVECRAGTDTTRVVTPAGVTAAVKAGVRTDLLLLTSSAFISYVTPVARQRVVPMHGFYLVPDNSGGVPGNIALDTARSGQAYNLTLHDKGGTNGPGTAVCAVYLPHQAKVTGLQVLLNNPSSAVAVTLGYRLSAWASPFNGPFTGASVGLQQNIPTGSKRVVNLTVTPPNTPVSVQEDTQEWYVAVSFPANNNGNDVQALRVLYDDAGPR